jgi:hypothetical protein
MASGTYNYSIPLTGGCGVVNATGTITVNPVDVSVNNNAPVLKANATGATYQWIDCNNNKIAITGEKNASFTATSNGEYAVVVTKNGCKDTSACIGVTNVGLTEHNFGSQIIVFPNPTTGNINIDFSGQTGIRYLVIKNVLGQTIYTSAINKENTKTVFIEGGSGMYFIELFNNTGERAIYKVVKE